MRSESAFGSHFTDGSVRLWSLSVIIMAGLDAETATLRMRLTSVGASAHPHSPPAPANSSPRLQSSRPVASPTVSQTAPIHTVTCSYARRRPSSPAILRDTRVATRSTLAHRMHATSSSVPYHETQMLVIGRFISAWIDDQRQRSFVTGCPDRPPGFQDHEDIRGSMHAGRLSASSRRGGQASVPGGYHGA
jgi:hypothetical protein